MSEIPQEELDHEVPITRDELRTLSKISGQLSAGINDWLNPPSGIYPKTFPDICANLIAQLPKLTSQLRMLCDQVQVVADRAPFEDELTKPTGGTAADRKIYDEGIRVKLGELISLAQMRAQISAGLNEWVNFDKVFPNSGADAVTGHLIDRLDIFFQAIKSISATLDEIIARNWGETFE